jgi:hypothetical protein
LFDGTGTSLTSRAASTRARFVVGGGMLSIASASPASSRLIRASELAATRTITRAIPGRPRKKPSFAASSMNCPSSRRTQR